MVTRFKLQTGTDLRDGAAASDEVCVVGVDVGVLALNDVPDHALGRLGSAVHKLLHSLDQAPLPWCMDSHQHDAASSCSPTQLQQSTSTQGLPWNMNMWEVT